ncbi:hypothetical protein CYMTET_6903 [Cymbomonas tetramitiformis]|uniref:Uncharacterized protein n=1 Tax=Cymbomonas tetramitiformis TaxID=36881 RepID=A0AAE0LI06_9CHLO|nr:hypothetical protein CYMTET_6903 [Cymbomonas tetramitiformis]
MRNPPPPRPHTIRRPSLCETAKAQPEKKGEVGRGAQSWGSSTPRAGVATKTRNPVLNVGAQQEAYTELAWKIAHESGHDLAKDLTIAPCIPQSKVRCDVNNFGYGSWRKEGKAWVLRPHAKHLFAKVEEAEGISITVNNDASKAEALKKVGIEPLALPSTVEEGKDSLEDTRECLLATWSKGLARFEDPEEEAAKKEEPRNRAAESEEATGASPSKCTRGQTAKRGKEDPSDKWKGKEGGEGEQGVAQSDEENRVNLVSRFPVGTAVDVYARPTDSDAVTDDPLEEKDYFTATGGFKCTAPLLEDKVTVRDLHAPVEHWVNSEDDLKLPSFFLGLEASFAAFRTPLGLL